MNPQTLSLIKKDIRKFHKLYEILIEMWNGQLAHSNNATHPETVQVGVILQNMGFNGVGTHDYSHEAKVEKLHNLHKVLTALNEYHNKNYMIHQAWMEVDCIISGHDMSEEFEEIEE